MAVSNKSLSQPDASDGILMALLMKRQSIENVLYFRLMCKCIKFNFKFFSANVIIYHFCYVVSATLQKEIQS